MSFESESLCSEVVGSILWEISMHYYIRMRVCSVKVPKLSYILKMLSLAWHCSMSGILVYRKRRTHSEYKRKLGREIRTVPQEV